MLAIAAVSMGEAPLPASSGGGIAIDPFDWLVGFVLRGKGKKPKVEADTNGAAKLYAMRSLKPGRGGESMKKRGTVSAAQHTNSGRKGLFTRARDAVMDLRRHDGAVGQLILVLVYVALNALFFTLAAAKWHVRAKKAGMSRVAFLAKAFGNLLNFNGAFILLPVLRPFLALLNQKFGSFSLAKVLPLNKNLLLHKTVASVIFVCVLGHVGFHYANFALRPVETKKSFNIPRELWTGEFLVACSCYVADRLVARSRWGLVGGRRVTVLQAVWEQPNVLKLVLSNKWRPRTGSMWTRVSYMLGRKRELLHYKTGQYLRLNCPYVSELQWHPFTISSPASDPDALTLHIKSARPGSWTSSMRELFVALMGDEDDVSFTSPSGQPGTWRGPGGVRLLRVDGPYPAPAQHVSEYDTVLLVGAGIGLTPFAGVLRDIIEYIWPHKNTTHKCPRHVYFHWACRRGDLASYAWFLDLLKGLHARYRGMATAGRGVVFQVYVHVTGPCSPGALAEVRAACGDHGCSGECCGVGGGACIGESSLELPRHTATLKDIVAFTREREKESRPMLTLADVVKRAAAATDEREAAAQRPQSPQDNPTHDNKASSSPAWPLSPVLVMRPLEESESVNESPRTASSRALTALGAWVDDAPALSMSAYALEYGLDTPREDYPMSPPAVRQREGDGGAKGKLAMHYLADEEEQRDAPAHSLKPGCWQPWIHVSRGRPKWDIVFADIRRRHRNEAIGVFHCGPMGHQIKELCARHTKIAESAGRGETQEKTIFTPHVEVF
eukprot:jgi/Chlat1/8816/Chrsp90S08120